MDDSGYYEWLASNDLADTHELSLAYKAGGDWVFEQVKSQVSQHHGALMARVTWVNEGAYPVPDPQPDPPRDQPVYVTRVAELSEDHTEIGYRLVPMHDLTAHAHPHEHPHGGFRHDHPHMHYPGQG